MDARKLRRTRVLATVWLAVLAVQMCLFPAAAASHAYKKIAEFTAESILFERDTVVLTTAVDALYDGDEWVVPYPEWNGETYYVAEYRWQGKAYTLLWEGFSEDGHEVLSNWVPITPPELGGDLRDIPDDETTLEAIYSDLNNDGKPELTLVTANTANALPGPMEYLDLMLYIFEGSSLVLREPLGNRFVFRRLTVGDVNLDELREIVVWGASFGANGITTSAVVYAKDVGQVYSRASNSGGPRKRAPGP